MTCKRNKLTVVSLFVIFSITCAANDNDSSLLNRDNEFGIHIGATTGMGLSYRYWMDKTGVQATLFPIKTDDYIFISAGLTLMRSFYHNKYIRVYGYLGSHAIIENTDTEPQYNIGLGPGFSFGKIVAFNIMFGLGTYDITDRFNILPSGEIGLYFKF